MNHVSILLFLLCIKYVHLEIMDFVVSPPKHKDGYKTGDKVILTCVVKGDETYSVIFSHNGKYIVENGQCNFIEYKCDTQTSGDRRNFILEIEKLVWNDGGDWLCLQGRDVKKKKIDIKVVGKVAPLKTSLIPTNNMQDKHLPEILFGKGIRTNPYDLTRGASVCISCLTGCSYPISTHEWSYRNVSIHSKHIQSANKTSKCKIAPDGNGIVTQSNVTIDCAHFQMVGSNEITCTMRESYDSQSVFILCPGGHKPWTLTNGEIIGISIAVALAALMIVMFFMSAKRVINSYRYGSVNQGIRV